MRLLAVLVLAAACGSRAPAPSEPARPGVEAGSGRDTSTTTRHAENAEVPHHDDLPLDGRPTTAECEAAVDHLIDLDVAERPADQKPVADELAKARAEMRTHFVPRCTRELTRAQTRCLTAASASVAAGQCG